MGVKGGEREERRERGGEEGERGTKPGCSALVFTTSTSGFRER